MRLTALTVALVATFATGLAGQQATDGSIALPVHGPKPADVVARLARQALAQPGDTAAWKALAGALPELALVGTADLESTFDAARLADSLSSAAPEEVTASDTTSVVPASATTTMRDLADIAWLRVRTALRPLASVEGPVRWGVLGTLLTILVLWAVLRTRRAIARARLRARYRDRDRAAPRQPAPPAPAEGRLWTARALASGGAQVTEIARQVGMAQEAVALALRLNGAEPTPAAAAQAPAVSPPNPAEVRLRRELRAGIGHLRDGRLTYGGAAR